MKPVTIERTYPSLGDDYKKPGILLILRMVLSVALSGVFYLAKLSQELNLILLLIAALVLAYDLVIEAVTDIGKRNFSKENLPVLIAVIMSFSIGRGAEGVIALLLLRLSYILRDYALFRTRKMICEAIEPDRKILKGSDADGEGENKEYPVGSTVIVYEGMAVPVDCVIRDGTGFVDLSFITGSSRKVPLSIGDYLPAGSVCTEGQFVAEAAQLPENALYRKMASALESGYGEMTETEKRLTGIAQYFLPGALVIAIILLLALQFAGQLGFTEVIRRVVTVIAIASPCGILLSIPLTYFSGMAAGRKNGVLFTHSKALESSSGVKALVFNKIGTLTDRSYLVTEIKSDKMDAATFLKVAAYAAANSGDSLAKAIVRAYGDKIDLKLVDQFIEYPNQGMSVTVDGIQILLGKGAFISENGVSIPENTFEGTRLHMSVNGIYAGWLSMNESIKQGVTAGYFKSLKSMDIDRIAMVSGDSRESDRLVANELGIDEYYAECSTDEKLLRIAEIKNRTEKNGKLAFVGDCRCGEKLFHAADAGILTDGIACRDDLSAADAVIMDSSIASIPALIKTARKTKRHILLSAIFGCCVKLVILVLAALGYAPIWFGLLIDFCASLAILLNCTGIYLKETNE